MEIKGSKERISYSSEDEALLTESLCSSIFIQNFQLVTTICRSGFDRYSSVVVLYTIHCQKSSLFFYQDFHEVMYLSFLDGTSTCSMLL